MGSWTDVWSVQSVRPTLGSTRGKACNVVAETGSCPESPWRKARLTRSSRGLLVHSEFVCRPLRLVGDQVRASKICDVLVQVPARLKRRHGQLQMENAAMQDATQLSKSSGSSTSTKMQPRRARNWPGLVHRRATSPPKVKCDNLGKHCLEVAQAASPSRQDHTKPWAASDLHNMALTWPAIFADQLIAAA